MKISTAGSDDGHRAGDGTGIHAMTAKEAASAKSCGRGQAIRSAVISQAGSLAIKAFGWQVNDHQKADRGVYTLQHNAEDVDRTRVGRQEGSF